MDRFLVTEPSDMKERGWAELDFVLISGDAYVDHPSFAPAVIGRYLESKGYRVGIIDQPDWNDVEAFKKLGKPRLASLVTAGNLDSMLNKFTAAKKVRRQDDYSPGGESGHRPDRATLVYANRMKEAYSDVPLIIGGIEASLRRFGHYDYWSDTVRRSILVDSKADVLVYGMGELQIVELADALEISKQSILNYETEKRQIPIDVLSKIATFFKIPIEAFFSDNYDNFEEIKNNNTIKIPIISKVSAGLGVYGRNEILDWLEVSKSIAKSATFATFIDGDSMEPKIHDDDLVLVQEVSMLDSGEIGIFFLNGDVYCKKFQYNEFTKEIILKSINPKYKPKEVTSDDEFRIIGRVVAVFDYTI